MTASSNLRLFAAVYPPPEVASQLCAAVGRVADVPEHRATSTGQVHMTLQFIGDTAPGELDAALESIERAAATVRPFTLRAHRLITLPQRGPSRLIAAETDLPSALAELHHRLVLRFARHPRPKNRQRFRPHLTLCRFRRPTPRFRLDQPVEVEPFEIRGMHLMRSDLSPAGARHTVVRTFTLSE